MLCPSPAPEQVEGPGHDRSRDGVVEVVQVVSDRLPVFAEQVSEIRQAEDPGYAPEEGVEGEFGEVHPGRTGWERDKGTDHGQAAGDEYGELTVPIEPFLGGL